MNTPVPSFCPYVEKFCKNAVAKRAKHRLDIDWENTISETELQENDSLEKHILPNTSKYFRYNPHVNKRIHDATKQRDGR